MQLRVAKLHYAVLLKRRDDAPPCTLLCTKNAQQLHVYSYTSDRCCTGDCQSFRAEQLRKFLTYNQLRMYSVSEENLMCFRSTDERPVLLVSFDRNLWLGTLTKGDKQRDRKRIVLHVCAASGLAWWNHWPSTNGSLRIRFGPISPMKTVPESVIARSCGLSIPYNRFLISFVLFLAIFQTSTDK